tara:strand:+ start:563 stop:1699 length:1137 start_codon:yes stop_codon:yes gene_type:complete
MKVIYLPAEYPTQDNPLAGIFILDQAKAFASNGFKVCVFYNYFLSLKKLSFRNFLNFFFRYKVFNKHKINHRFTFLISTYFESIKLFLDFYLSNIKLKKYIKEHGKPDLLLCHFSYPVANTAARLSKIYNIPFYVTEHSTGYFTNLFNQYQLKTIINSLNKAKKIFAVSKHLKNKLIKLNVKTDIKVIGNIIDPKIFRIKQKKRSKNLRLLIVCELVKKKRVQDLLQILKEIKPIYKNFKLSIIGDGAEKYKLQNFIRNNNLIKNVTIYGILDKRKIANFMNKSDFLISASKIETFGITIAEAISSGLPCIIYNSGGPSDFAKTFNSYTVHSFKEMKSVIIKNLHKRKIFDRKKMHHYIKKEFNPKKIAELYKSELNF